MEHVDTRQETFQAEMVPHMESLYYFALGKTRDPEDAKDLLQDTYLNAYRYLDKYTPGTNAKGWLTRIMMNSFINRYRKESKTAENVSYDGAEEFHLVVKASETYYPEPQRERLDNQLGDETARALEELPNDYRTVVILCDIEEYSYEEIADFAEIPIGTVRSRLHRARKLLRSMLKDYAIEHGYETDNGKAEKGWMSGESAGEMCPG